MLSADQLRKFNEDGFLNFGPAISSSALIELRAALENVVSGNSTKSVERIANLSSDGREVTQIVNIWEAENAFKVHLYNEKIVEMIAQFMSTDEVRVWHDQIQIKPPRIGGPTIWHQDFPYWKIMQPAGLISAWVALDDATIENGCMWMVPGSHKWGEYKSGTIGQKADELSPDYDPVLLPSGAKVEIVPCEVAAGSVVFHHCLTWHGAPPNKSDKNRPAIAVHYMPGSTRFVPSGGHLIQHHVKVQPGELLKGDAFPTVMEAGRVLSPS